MHKKRVYNKEYFYTTIRDKEKTKGVYLGNNYKTAKLKEEELKRNNHQDKSKPFLNIKFPKLSAFLIIIAFILIFSIVFFNLKYTGFTTLNQFDNALTTETLTFTDGITENITRYISLNKNMNISSAYLNLTDIGTWIKQSDRYFIGSVALGGLGIQQAYGITTNGSDFWVVDNSKKFVFHLNGSFDNQTDGFSTAIAGDTTPQGITTNGSDFWIMDSVDQAVYHFNSSGKNVTSGNKGVGVGFSVPIFDDMEGITTNGSDFWIVGWRNDFVYHYNSSGDNQTDGFYIFPQVRFGTDITTNGSDFWISDRTQRSGGWFISHFDKLGNNLTDGFFVTNGTQLEGLTTNFLMNGGDPTDFWFLDDFDDFIHHYALNYTSNPDLDVGNDSIQEWNHTGSFNLVNNKTTDFASAINNYLSSCTADANGNCSVPFVFHSDTTGNIQYSDIQIDYADILNPTLTLTPATDTAISLGGSITISCTGADNVGLSSTSIKVDGNNFCSGIISCSSNYQMSTSGSRIVTCTATDTSGNSASKSITLSTSGGDGGGGGGGGDGGGSPGPVVQPPVIQPPVVEPPVETIPPVTQPPIIETPTNFIPIIVPQTAITGWVSNGNAIVDIGNLAQIIYSYIDVSGVKKPKVDISFSQKNLRDIKSPININYFDWLKYLIISLSLLILVLIIIYTLHTRVERFK